jgi:hypothetical protein
MATVQEATTVPIGTGFRIPRAELGSKVPRPACHSSCSAEAGGSEAN